MLLYIFELLWTKHDPRSQNYAQFYFRGKDIVPWCVQFSAELYHVEVNCVWGTGSATCDKKADVSG